MIKINLLRHEKKEPQEQATTYMPEIIRQKKPPKSYFFYLLLIVAVGSLFLHQYRALSKENDLLKILQEDKKKLQDVLVILEQLENQKSLFENKIGLITQLKANQKASVIIMDELSKKIPEWVWLSEITYSTQKTRIKGGAISNSLIADYIYNLEESPYFMNVELISSTQLRSQSSRYLEFLLEATYIHSPTESSLSEGNDIGETE